VRWENKVHFDYFLSNICAKNCRNRTAYVTTIASHRWEFFETRCRCGLLLPTEERGLSVCRSVCLSVCHSIEPCKTCVRIVSEMTDSCDLALDGTPSLLVGDSTDLLLIGGNESPTDDVSFVRNIQSFSRPLIWGVLSYTQGGRSHRNRRQPGKSGKWSGKSQKKP